MDKRKNKPVAGSEEEEVEPRPVDAGVASAQPDDASPDESGAPSSAETEEKNRDYLQDLLRERAEFDNFRKRTFRERQQAEARGKRQIVEHLLPVLDNFERAISHGEGGDGVELVFKELKSVLANEGLVEIVSDEAPFDPKVHEAVESVEDPEVDQPTVTQVYRRGYSFGGDVIRPAMVVVARPADDAVAEAGDATTLGGAAGGA